MDRILQGTQASIGVQFAVDGTNTDPSPDTATVTITRADGTALLTAQDATQTGVGSFGYTLTPTDTALLDTLTAAWTATINGAAQTVRTQVEIVGGFLCSLADLRALDPLQNTTEYTTARLLRARTQAEVAIEKWCGAFVPRYRYRTFAGVRDTLLNVGDPYVTSVRSASVYGTALTETVLDAIIVDGSWITGMSNWYPGPVAVGYEYGRPFAPADAARPTALLARWYLVESPTDDRYTSISNDFGTFTLTTPGVRGAYTALPEVNAFIESERLIPVA